jgi:hypothetical protein
VVVKFRNKKKFEKLTIKIHLFMNLDTAFFSFLLASLAIGVTILTIYGSFGPDSQDLLDPFEEDAD